MLKNIIFFTFSIFVMYSCNTKKALPLEYFCFSPFLSGKALRASVLDTAYYQRANIQLGELSYEVCFYKTKCIKNTLYLEGMVTDKMNKPAKKIPIMRCSSIDTIGHLKKVYPHEIIAITDYKGQFKIQTKNLKSNYIMIRQDDSVGIWIQMYNR
ncbi:MAG: hypothetical protein RI894_1463 [Bacteroidota bacterium]|jgi:hypothetical protein